MALTFTRWAAVALLASGALAVALLPPPPREPARMFSPGERTRLQRLTTQLNRAREANRIAQLTEEIARKIQQEPLPAGRAPTVLDIGASTAERRAEFAGMLQRWWPRVEFADSVAVGIVLGGDSAKPLWQSQYLLPTSTNGKTCFALVPTPTWRLTDHLPESAMQRRLASEMGPCLFFAMYGRPGPDIERWINGKGIDFLTWFNPSERWLAPDSSPGADAEGPIMFDMEWAVYGTMPLAQRCLSGRIAECASAVLPADGGARPLRPGFRAPSLPWRAPFGSLTGSFLGDLHRAIGPGKFRAFWKSRLPLDQAFAEATRTGLGEWTYQWARGRRGAFRPGPLPERRSVVRVAGLAVLLLGIAAVYSTRRSVH